MVDYNNDHQMLDVWPVGLEVRFTPGAAVGSVGPTLEQVRAVLRSDAAIRNHPDLRVDGGVITLPLLPTGYYHITIAGASGRNVFIFGGKGKGMILTTGVHSSASSSAPWRLIVGQMHSEQGGGGGGSFMFQGEELLLVAGGGGGGGGGGIHGRGIIADDPGTNGIGSGTGILRYDGGKGWREIANYLSGGPIASDSFSFGGGGQGSLTHGGGGGGYSGGSGSGGGSSFAHPRLTSTASFQITSDTNLGSGFIEIQRIV